jgi:hypothetical protein
MRSSAQPTHPTRGPAPGDRSGQRVLRGARERPGSHPERRETKPIEAIEVKPWQFNEMYLILINRSHWIYLAFFQMITSKNRPISGNCGSPRTRIQRKAGSPTPMILKCPLDSVGRWRRRSHAPGFALGRCQPPGDLRILCRRVRASGRSPAAWQGSKAGMLLYFNRMAREGCVTHQDWVLDRFQPYQGGMGRSQALCTGDRELSPIPGVEYLVNSG